MEATIICEYTERVELWEWRKMTAVCVLTPVACCSILSLPVERLTNFAIYDAVSVSR